MNAIDFLVNEHNKVRKMFDDISKDSHQEATKKKLFNELCDDLIRHETMEHTVWYPHIKKQLSEEVHHLLGEEKQAEKAIKQFDGINSFEEWEVKFNKLKKDVEHHANEEETKLFPQVKKFLSEEDLEKIGKEMSDFKKNYTD